MLFEIKNYVGLFVQRLLRNNCVKSIYVSPKSLIGTYIEIGRLTQIDQFSVVGSYTYIGDRCSVTRAWIGSYVSIGNNVSIGPGEHDLKKYSTSSHFYEDVYNELTRGDCRIESDAWIGVDAVILRGVRVGVGAVVAANSVVTKNVPDYAVVAGVPANIIKYRFSEHDQAVLLSSKWWAQDKNSAKVTFSRLRELIK